MEPIFLPTFTDLEWLLPNIHTNEAFYTKLAVDFAATMKAKIGGSFAHLQWFLGIGTLQSPISSAIGCQICTAYGVTKHG